MKITKDQALADLGFPKYKSREQPSRVIYAGEIAWVKYTRRTPSEELGNDTSLGWEIGFTCGNTIWRTNDYTRETDCRIGRMLIIPTRSNQSIPKDVFMAEYEPLN